jgi:dihydrofolate reductase
MIKAIVAVGPNLAIGYKNRLPWNCKADLEYFKSVTSECAVLMGKNTWESLNGRYLKNRVNYILSTTLHEELSKIPKNEWPDIYKNKEVKSCVK